MDDLANLDLSQPPLSSVVGYVACYYLPAHQLAAEPLVRAGLVVGDLTPVFGVSWRQLPFTPNTIKFTETPKESRGTPLYQVKVQGDRPQPIPGVLDAIATLERVPLVLLLREAGGALRLVGSKEAPLQLRATGAGQNPAQRSGLDVLLAGVSRRLAPYYQGALSVAGINQAAPVVRTGQVQVLDRAGNLMLVAPAGTTIVITSGFHVTLAVQS